MENLVSVQGGKKIAFRNNKYVVLGVIYLDRTLCDKPRILLIALIAIGADGMVVA